MKKYYNNIFTIFFFCFLGNVCLAQTFIGKLNLNDPNQNHFIVLNDENEFYGQILSINNLTVEFQEDEFSSKLILKLSDIEKIFSSAEGIDLSTKDGRIELTENENNEIKYLTKKYENEGDHRLFYSETGFCLKEGTSEYRTIWGLVHTVDYGLSDGFTIGLGYIHPGYILGHMKFNYIGAYINSKFRAGFDFKTAAKSKRVFNDLSNEYETQWEGFIKMSSYFSYGIPSRKAHIAINIIPLFDGEDFFEGGLVTFSFGGMIKLTDHWKLIYENTFGALETNVSNFGFFSGLGANWHNRKHSIKFGINSSPNFGFFNIPVNELNPSARLPFFSYSRFF